MKYLFYAAAVAAISTPAYAESWRSVNEWTDYPAIITYVDTDSISYVGNDIELTYREFIESQFDNGSNNFVQRRRLNCSSNTYTILNHQYYSGSTPQGDPSQDSTRYDAKENTADRRLQDAVCGKTSYLTGPVSDPSYDAEDFFYYLDDW